MKKWNHKSSVDTYNFISVVGSWWAVSFIPWRMLGLFLRFEMSFWHYGCNIFNVVMLTDWVLGWSISHIHIILLLQIKSSWLSVSSDKFLIQNFFPIESACFSKEFNVVCAIGVIKNRIKEQDLIYLVVTEVRNSCSS